MTLSPFLSSFFDLGVRETPTGCGYGLCSRLLLFFSHVYPSWLVPALVALLDRCQLLHFSISSTCCSNFYCVKYILNSLREGVRIDLKDIGFALPTISDIYPGTYYFST